MSVQARPTDADLTTCEGAEVSYSIEDTVVDAVRGSAIYPSGNAMGAVVVIIGTDCSQRARWRLIRVENGQRGHLTQHG